MHVILLTYAYYYLKLLERYTTVNAVTTRMIWQHRKWFSEISNSGGLFGYLLFRWPISYCWFAFCRGSWMRVWARRHKFSAMDTTSLGSIDLAVTQHRCVCVCVCVCSKCTEYIYKHTTLRAYIHTYMNAYIQRAKFQPKYDEVTGTKLGLTTQTINGRSLFKSRDSGEISACLDDEVTKLFTSQTILVVSNTQCTQTKWVNLQLFVKLNAYDPKSGSYGDFWILIAELQVLPFWECVKMSG
jgi:hypothetical protein